MTPALFFHAKYKQLRSVDKEFWPDVKAKLFHHHY